MEASSLSTSIPSCCFGGCGSGDVPPSISIASPAADDASAMVTSSSLVIDVDVAVVGIAVLMVSNDTCN